MLKFGLLPSPEMKPLIDALLEQDVDVYLHGYLKDKSMPFVDIGWNTSARLNEVGLPSGWTLIYAFFISSEAVAQNQSDPLMGNVSIHEILQNYQPKHLSAAQFKENMQGLIDQAEYLMGFPPSRLVWLQHEMPGSEDIRQLIAHIVD
ncbi:hypothetical protein [Gynuella sunshinyii]|uniref:Uncharacterized protein n=1 Tax=Gynuella sunshinyii YC6258 TaxID=1445510 RepID=A0A0C5W279_9GAMM|nr:hypothetical protein [Gynuella sunshinyii]AJQ96759.1 hypothetical Protein YC6258_04727 [Gynuella sunshinyii YC6258]